MTKIKSYIDIEQSKKLAKIRSLESPILSEILMELKEQLQKIKKNKI